MGKKIIIQQIYSPNQVSGPSTEFNFVLHSKTVNESFEQISCIYTGEQGFLGRKAIKFYKDFFKKNKSDLIVIRGAGPDGLFAVIGARRAGCKNILVGIHGLYSDICNIGKIKKVFFSSFVEKNIFKKCSYFYTVCNKTYETHISLQRFEKKYLGTIYNPAPNYNLNDFNKKRRIYRNTVFGCSDDKTIVLYVGRITEDKGLLFLLDSIESILGERNDVVFVFAGVGNLTNYIIERMKDYIEHKTFIFLGERNDVEDLLFASDLFVFPSLRENHPFSILEAMASGVFIISTNVGGIPETLVEYTHKSLINPKDSSALNERIVWFLESNKKYNRFDIGWEKSTKLFSTQNIENEILKKYNLAMQKRKK